MTDQTAKKLRVAAVADLHAHKAHQGEFRPLFTDLADRADVVLLPGDLTNLGLPEEAESLAADLALLRVPVLAVLGNHDYHSGRPEEIKAVLRTANVQFLEDETFELHGASFVGVKGFAGGFGNHMLSAFGEEATKRFVNEAVNEALALENALRTAGGPDEAEVKGRTVVALHYSPIPETIAGEPAEILPFLGCARLGETIDRFRVSAVFHGHAHHGSLKGKTRRGVPVYNCSLPLLRHKGGPGYVVVEV